jgi:predicted regulator of Ras-like GTPase activity (Roadblock/LC7/MglB family)
MTIPFLDLFKKLRDRFAGGATAAEISAPAQTRVVRPKKPESERLSKTVMPHSTRSSTPPDPFRSAAATAAAPRSSLPMELGARRITTSSGQPRASQLPPALARALEPKVERTISLRVADLLDGVPAGFIKPVEILDTNAVVLLKASEIEKGMPEKHPMISLPSLYQQVPEIFLRSVRPDDQTRVELPYQKVLEQFQNVHVRADQERDPVAPHVDTPILKATVEDSERFGTKIDPIETSTLPPVPVRHATAKSIADAEPDATPVIQKAVASTASRPKAISLHSPELAPKADSSAPSSTASDLKIPFEVSSKEVSSKEVSPNGTGASASERVPASSGPPVPTPLPFTPELEKVAFEPPPEEFKAPGPAKLTISPTKTPEEKPSQDLKLMESRPARPKEKLAASDERKIHLSVKAVLKGLPAFQLDGDVAAIADDAQVALPLSLIEPQLATGRILIAPDVFQTGMPEQYRQFFQIDEAKTAVVLPLEEVLKNLPATVLKLRDDQEHFELQKDFETPFSIKAKEDAKKFAAEKKTEEKAPAPKSEETQGKAKVDIPLAVEKLDPKEVVTQVTALPGVKACAITFSDGLSLAGELPEDAAADGLCAMAPSVLGRIAQHVRGTKLGNLVAVTIHATNSAISFFARGNICLTALHADGSLPAETKTKIAELAGKLSEQYTKRE